jgi:hypothetical protein
VAEAMDNGHGRGTGAVPVMTAGVGAANPVAVAGALPLTARDLRATIFSSANKKPKSKLVQFYGVEIEVRQASLSKVLELVRGADQQSVGWLNILLNYAYVPGTNEPVFDEANVDEIMSLPYGPDMAALTDAFTSLTTLDVAAAEKNS